jgi:hypothetical protein
MSSKPAGFSRPAAQAPNIEKAAGNPAAFLKFLWDGRVPNLA